MSSDDATGVTDGSARQYAADKNPAKQAGSGSRLRLRNWSVRAKLVAVLIIPTITALVLGGLQVSSKLSEANQFQHTADQVNFASKVTAVVHELQAERTLAVTKAGSRGGQPEQALRTQMADVDRAAYQARQAFGQLQVDDSAARHRYEQGLQRLDALGPLREANDTTPFSDVSAYTTYSSVLDELVQLGREVNTAVTDRELLRQSSTTQAVSETKEFYTREDAALQIAAQRDGFPGDLLDKARDAHASGAAAENNFEASANPGQQQMYSDTVSGPEVDGRERVRSAAVVRAGDNLSLGVDSDRLTTVSNATADKLRTVESTLLDDLGTNADNLADSATIGAWRDAAIVLGALLVALVLMLVIARTLVRPLRELRADALEVAYTRLPNTVQGILAAPNPAEASRSAVAPVPVNTREEIGQVARSFDEVHEQAVRMASEQALLRENVNGIFVNLSRRSQRLVERQLGVIDRLESDEQDPDQLASLFELDHLATRLRRNGESLLVLSGAGLAKSVPRPVPAADVIGAAVSEIEQYARVEVGAVPDVNVQGPTIHDLVHLLAELLDNSTYFAEPDTKVSVRAVVTRQQALAIQITDRGVGMSPEQLAQANERLADPPDLDVSVTRRMGLYVVARLAKRHGIEVRLRDNEDIEGGLIARIVVPSELLVDMPHTAPQRAVSDDSDAGSGQPTAPETTMNGASATVADATASPQGVGTANETGRQGGRPQPDAASSGAADSAGGLVPLNQPISLDDLEGVNAGAAGPFIEPDTQPPPTPAPRPRAEPTAGASDEGAGGAPEAGPSLALPKRQPQYVPVTPSEPDHTPPPGSGGSALEEDAPTRRLPIYQSVLSRWFSEVDQPDTEVEDADIDTERGPAATGQQPETDPSQPPTTEQAVPKSQDESWGGASDSGWQAAQQLFESPDEEITQAGLPKRVPNAYLVPGSIKQHERGSVTDASTADVASQQGQGAIARSATAARSRMASFQRGYTSGRHALQEGPADSDAVGVSGAAPHGSHE